MAIALGIAMPGRAQQSVNNDDARRAFATHDYTTTTGSSTTLDERWVDVKTPGNLDPADAKTYVVGTIDVTDTGKRGEVLPSVLYFGTGSFQWSIPQLPSGSYEFTVQGIFLLSSSPWSCDPNANPVTVASPGLVISY